MPNEQKTKLTVDSTSAVNGIKSFDQALGILVKQMKEVERTQVSLSSKGKVISESFKLQSASGEKLKFTLSGINSETQKLSVSSQGYVKNTKEIEKANKAASQSSKERLAIAKKLATQLDKKVTGGVTQAGLSGASATTAQIQDLQNARGKLRELVLDRVKTEKGAATQIKRIWAAVAQGKITVETGANRKIQQSILAVQKAQTNLGKTSQRVLATQNRQLETSVKRTKALSISWQSVSKLLAGRALSTAIYQISAALRQSVQDTIDFRKSIAAIQTIDVADLGYETWARQVRSLSDSFGIDIVDQAKAAYETLSNQVAKGAEAFQFLESANRLALTTLSTVEQSQNLLSATINAFKLNVNDADIIAAKFFKTVELGRIKVSDLHDSFGRVAVIAGQVGISLDELLASLETLTVQGVKARETMSALRGLFQKFLNPTKAMSAILNKYNFETGQAAIETLGFVGVLELLQNETKGNVAELAKVSGRIRSTSALIGLTGKNFERYTENLRKTKEATESYNEATARVLGNVGKRLETEFNRIENFFKKDVFETGVVGLSNFIDSLGSLSEIVKGLANALGIGLVGALSFMTAKLIVATGLMVKSALVTAAYSAATGVTTTSLITLSGVLTVIKAKLIAANVAMGPIGLAIAAVTVVISAGIFAWNAYGNSVEEATAKGHKELVRRTKLIQKEYTEIEKSVEKQQKLFERLGRNRENAFVVISAKIKEAFESESEGLIERYEKVFKETEKAADKAKKAVNKTLKSIKGELDDTQKAIKGLEAGTGVQEESRQIQERVFETRLEGQDPQQQLFTLSQRARQLSRESLSAAASGDKSLFEDIREEIQGIVEQKDEIRKSDEIGLSNSSRARRFESEANSALSERVRHSKTLLGSLQKQEKSLQNQQKAQEKLKGSVEDSVKELKKGDPEEIFKKLLKGEDVTKDLEGFRKATKSIQEETGTSGLEELFKAQLGVSDDIIKSSENYQIKLKEVTSLKDTEYRLDLSINNAIVERNKLIVIQKGHLRDIAEISASLESDRTIFGSGGRTFSDSTSAAFKSTKEVGEGPFTDIIPAFNEKKITATLDAYREGLAFPSTSPDQLLQQKTQATGGLLELFGQRRQPTEEEDLSLDVKNTQQGVLDVAKAVSGLDYATLINLADSGKTADEKLKELTEAIKLSTDGEITNSQRKIELDRTILAMQTAQEEGQKTITETLHTYGLATASTNEQMIDLATDGLPKFKAMISEIIKLAEGAGISGVVEPIKKAFGGFIGGNRRGGMTDGIDSQHILADPKEFLVRGSVAQKYGQELNFLNRYGKMPTAIKPYASIDSESRSQESIQLPDVSLVVNESSSPRQTAHETWDKINREIYLGRVPTRR